jgi:hypothetical protein
MDDAIKESEQCLGSEEVASDSSSQGNRQEAKTEQCI